MKKLTLTAVPLLLALTLASCGSTSTPAASATTPSTTNTTNAATKVEAVQADGSFGPGEIAPDFKPTGKLSAQSLLWTRIARPGETFTITTPGGEYGFSGLNQYGYNSGGWYQPGTYVCEVAPFYASNPASGCFFQRYVNTFQTTQLVVTNGWTTDWSMAATMAVVRLGLTYKGYAAFDPYGQQRVYNIGYYPTDSEYYAAQNYLRNTIGWGSSFAFQYYGDILNDPSYRKVVYAMAYIYQLKSDYGVSNAPINGSKYYIRFRPYDPTGSL